ncbi:hypothetical protein G5V59_07860 [Nocardioides sp. W3-2-3]|nr:hypothetical protein [Nocardioides convexus]
MRRRTTTCSRTTSTRTATTSRSPRRPRAGERWSSVPTARSAFTDSGTGSKVSEIQYTIEDGFDTITGKPAGPGGRGHRAAGAWCRTWPRAWRARTSSCSR